MTVVSSSDFSGRLVGFIATELAMTDEPVDADTDLLVTGLVDSLGVFSIVDVIESDLGITVDHADVVLENFRSVSAMCSYLRGRGVLDSS